MNPIRQGIKAVMSAVLPRERWLASGPKKSSGIALTFDDGPHPEYTPRLLDELLKFQIRATFFVVGEAVARFPDITRRIVAEGHTLAGHTYTHSEPSETSTTKLLNEVRQSLALIEDLTGQQLTLFRPPKGKLSLTKTLGLWKLKQTIVLWNCDPRDYQAVAPQGIQSWVRQYRPAGGDIVLMHDTHPHCIGAIEPLVQRIADRGFSDFITVDEWVDKKTTVVRSMCEKPVSAKKTPGQVQLAQQGIVE